MSGVSGFITFDVPDAVEQIPELVDPVDEQGDHNLPSHPELLDELARQFTDHHYDLKYLVRAIVASKAYQRTSTVSSPNKDDPRQEKLWSVKFDGSGMQSLSAANGSYAATFADDGMHFVETHSAALTRSNLAKVPCAGMRDAFRADASGVAAASPGQDEAKRCGAAATDLFAQGEQNHSAQVMFRPRDRRTRR